MLMTLENHKILPIMLALCLMLLPSYYAQNYAGINQIIINQIIIGSNQMS